MTSFVDFTESGTEGANLEFPSGILWRSSVTSINDLGLTFGNMPLRGSSAPPSVVQGCDLRSLTEKPSDVFSMIERTFYYFYLLK